jgi:hypothetical protein
MDLFKDNEPNQKYFDENKLDMTKQDEIIKLLSEIGFVAAVPDTIKIYKLYDASLKELYTDLYKIGIVPT